MIGRISQKSVFGRLSREGTYARHRGVWVSCLVDPSLNGPHVAYAVGRRAGNAVMRNRLRRQLRQIVAHQEPALRSAWYLLGVTSTDQVSSWQALSEATATALDTVHRRLDHIAKEVAN